MNRSSFGIVNGLIDLLRQQPLVSMQVGRIKVRILHKVITRRKMKPLMKFKRRSKVKEQIKLRTQGADSRLKTKT